MCLQCNSKDKLQAVSGLLWVGAWQITWHLNNPHPVRFLSTANSLTNPSCPHMPSNQGWFSVGSDSNTVIVWLLVCHFQLLVTFDFNLSFLCHSLNHSPYLEIWCWLHMCSADFTKYLIWSGMNGVQMRISSQAQVSTKCFVQNWSKNAWRSKACSSCTANWANCL